MELALAAAWGLLIPATSLLIVWYGGRLVLSGHGSAGDIFAFQIYAVLLIQPVWQIAEICKKNNVLLMLDEIQTGLGRTGKLFAAEHEDVRPDVTIIGKALSGGFYPVSAVLADKDLLGLFKPGEHGSTFGGNPLAAAVARAALGVIREEDLAERSRELGEYFIEQLAEIPSPHVKEVRGKGLLIGVELKPEAGGARRFCEAMQEKGILAKETHDHVIRFAPPLVIDKETIDWALPSTRVARPRRRVGAEAPRGQLRARVPGGAGIGPRHEPLRARRGGGG